MSEVPRFPISNAFGGRVKLIPVTIDEISEVRALERGAFAHFHGARTTEAEMDAFRALIVSASHTDNLVASVRNDALYSARLDKKMIGIVGWSLSNGTAQTCRLRLLYVDHLFAKNGVGGMLLDLLEKRAKGAGGVSVAVKTPVNSARFFEARGYELTSFGSFNLSDSEALSVAYLRKSL